MVRQSSRARLQTLERASTAEPALATVSRENNNGRTTVVLSWDFSASRERVWQLLTSPEQLVAWAPFTADRDLSQVGRAVLRMIDEDTSGPIELACVVFAADPPQLLEHSWAADTLAWRLSVAGALTRLTLHQTLADERMASAITAGWHLCLVVATSVLGGHPEPPIRGMAALEHGWRQLNERYAVALGVPASVIA
jgi:uncharacterized protein YndB with AHSA1/START domain